MRPRSFGAYVLLEQIAEGAQGDVWLARRRQGPAEPIVIKRVVAERAHDPGMRRRFLHEAQIASVIDHPNVVPVLECGEIDGRLYLVMAYVDGTPLSQVLRGLRRVGETITIATIVDIMSDLLSGLHALHEATDTQGQPLSIVHRDIAPKNLMFDSNGSTRIIDLGIGRSDARDWETATGLLVGTPGYISPEQVVAKHVDRRADLFCAGLLLFELLTLERYLVGDSLAKVLAATLDDHYRPPSSVRPDVPAELDDIVRKSVEIRPEDRFQTARLFHEALRAVVPASPGPKAADLVRQVEWEGVLAEKSRLTELIAEAPTAPMPESAPASESVSVPSPRSAPAVLFGAVGVATLLATAALSAWLLSEPQIIVADPAPPMPRATATPLPKATAIAPPPAAPAPTVVEPPPAPEKRRTPVQTPKRATPAPPSAPPPVSAAPTLDELLRRANKLRTAASTAEQQKEADQLLARINRLFVVRAQGKNVDTEAAARAIRALETRFRSE